MTTSGNSTVTSQYAGDITPLQAWDMLKEDNGAVLVDVRTDAEWAYVGLPDLSKIGKNCALISWARFPDMSPNPAFLQNLQDVQPEHAKPVLFLCRSGVRSIAAAVAATSAGYSQCYNILEGFEGNHDTQAHRGAVSGWKASNLDWKQS